MTQISQADSNLQHVVACIDDSIAVPAICHYAAWASLRAQVSVILLHVLEQDHPIVEPDLSGNIGLGSREHLLKALTALDQRRSRTALEHGHQLLDDASSRIQAAGVERSSRRQRHGDLTESLLALEDETLMLVMGLHGERNSNGHRQIGSQLETVIRHVHRPVLLVPEHFVAPRRAMLAFDGSTAALKGIESLSEQAMLRDMPMHIVMVGNDTPEQWEQLNRVKAMLATRESDIHVAIREGDVVPTLQAYQVEHDLDLLVIGAYGHSRVRQFLLGSTTTALLHAANTPLLVLR